MAGIVIVFKYGYGHFQSLTQCEGIGFGCSLTGLSGAFAVSVVLIMGVAATAIAARVAHRDRWLACAIGIALTFAASAATWNANVVHRPVPTASYVDGRRFAERTVDAMRHAVSTSTNVERPTLAEALTVLEETPAQPCRDRSERSLGGVEFSWEGRIDRRVDLTAKPGALSSEDIAHTEQIARSLQTLGYAVTRDEVRPYLRIFRAQRQGPPPRGQNAGVISTTYFVEIEVAVTPIGPKPFARASVRLSTPCLAAPTPDARG